MLNSKGQSFYRNLNLKRCLLMSSPFLAAALASQELSAQLTINVTNATQLRAAITTVNASSTNDTINVAAGTYALTGAALDNANVSGDLDITKATGNLSIIGAGAGTTTIDGATLDRVFHINAGAAGTVTIQNLTIQNGRASDNGTGATEAHGGAILLQQGNLTLSNVAISNNSAQGANGAAGAAGITATTPIAPNGQPGTAGAGAAGGGLYVSGGTVQITGCTLAGNSATGGSGGAGGAGADGGATFTPSTAYFIAGGGGSGASGGGASGGAIFINAGNVTIVSSTLLSSSAVGGTGAAGGAGGANTSLYQNGGSGGAGGTGGAVAGGACFVGAGSLTITESTLANSSATAGNGAVGGQGGNGYLSDGDGGTGGEGGAASGGGVFVASGASTVITSTTLDGGTVSAGAGGNGGHAPGYFATFGGNGGAGGNGGSALGGGVFVVGSATIINSTVSGGIGTPANGGNGGNGAVAWTQAGLGGDGGNGGDAGFARGGALYIEASGTLDIDNSTVAGGQVSGAAPGSGGTPGSGGAGTGTAGSTGATAIPVAGNAYNLGTVTSDSSIFADGTATATPDFFGNVTAGASLFETAPSGTVTAGTGANITGVDPGLSALANNGGPTETHAISAGSAAQNVGSNPLTLTTDQRGTGFNRVSGGTADIGAFEIQTGGGGQTANPTVTNPATAVTVNATTFNVQGTAVANSLVRVYSDLNNDGVVNGADAVVGSQQLTGGATSYSVSVPLTQDAANNFTATADDPTNTESNPVNVPTITEDSTAPTGMVVTDPATAVNTTGATYNIQGTAEANSLVQIYSDANNNGVIDGADAVVASGTATGGNFNISTPISIGTANNFTATAEDAAGNESGPTDVPTITETTAITSPPLVTTPATAVTVNQATFDIQGTAVADSLVRIYSDANNNGVIDGADAIVGSQQLTGGATAFSINVALTQNAANNFTATADDATNPESNPVNVPTITDNNGGGNNNGSGNGNSSSSCASQGSSRSSWLPVGAMLAAAFAAMRLAFRRRQD
jgi:hypothetical protein